MSSSSSSSSTASSVTIAILSSMVLGGTVGAACMAAYLSNNNNNNNKKRDDGGGAGDGDGILSRDVLVFGEDHNNNVTTPGSTTTTQHQYHQNFDDVTHRNFLSDIIARLWPYINQAGSTMIRESVEPSFRDSMPGPLKSLHFTTIDLGSTPIIIDNIVVHQENTQDNFIQFDWDVVWNTTCNIQLAASYGVAFGVKAIELRGRMSFLLKPLSNVIPCIDAVQYSFINPPVLELDFTGLANVADFSIVENTIRTILQDTLASMVVLPIRMMTKLTPTTNFLDIHTPLKGVARVTLHKGRGFQEESRTLRSTDVPDVYVRIKLGASKEWTSPTISNHLNPDWTSNNKAPHDNVTDFVLSDLDQILNIEAWDEDHGTMDADDFLGCAQVTIGQVLLAGGTLEVELWSREKKGSSRPTGAFVTISVNVLPFTTSEHSSLVSNQIEKAPIHPDNQLVGLLTVLVTQAFDLPLSKKDVASFVKVLHGDTEIGVTGTVVDLPGYDALNPLYEIPFYVPLSPSMWKKKESIQLQLMNKETVLGVLSVTQDELLKAKNGTIQEKRAIGTEGAALEFSVSLSGVAASNSTTGTLDAKKASSTTSGSAPTTSSSAAGGPSQQQRVKLSIVKGFGFEARKKRRFKKTDVPDIYCIVKFGSNPQSWRTSTVKNCTTPTWKDETKIFEMYSPNNIISIDVYDENSRTKDDYYGNARIAVGKVLLAGGSTDVEISTKDGNSKSGLFLTIQVQKL